MFLKYSFSFRSDAARAPQLKASVGLLRLTHIMKAGLSHTGYVGLALGFLVFTLRSCDERRSHNGIFLVPEGYIGWYRVDYNVPNTPTLPTEIRYGNEWRVFALPANGWLKTSSPHECCDETVSEWFYVLDGSRQELKNVGWAQASFPRNGMVCESWFVGTQDQYEKYGKSPEKDSNGCVVPGNLNLR